MATLYVSSLVIEALAPTLVGVPGAGTFSTMMALLAVAVRFYTMPVESLSMCDERDGHMGWVVYVDTGMVSSLKTPHPSPLHHHFTYHPSLFVRCSWCPANAKRRIAVTHIVPRR